METSLRYDGDSKALRIHAKEKYPISDTVVCQLQGELDTRVGAPIYLSGMIKFFYPDVSGNFSLGVQCDRQRNLQYGLRGKTVFPVTSDGLVNFTVKGQCNMPEDFGKLRCKGALEFVWNIFNIKKDQDLRLKVGYNILDQISYLQIRENNWTFNVNQKRRWDVRYDL